jgi:hypothetical protein
MMRRLLALLFGYGVDKPMYAEVRSSQRRWRWSVLSQEWISTGEPPCGGFISPRSDVKECATVQLLLLRMRSMEQLVEEIRNEKGKVARPRRTACRNSGRA